MGGYPGTKGLAFKEALLWERASKGRVEPRRYAFPQTDAGGD